MGLCTDAQMCVIMLADILVSPVLHAGAKDSAELLSHVAFLSEVDSSYWIWRQICLVQLLLMIVVGGI